SSHGDGPSSCQRPLASTSMSLKSSIAWRQRSGEGTPAGSRCLRRLADSASASPPSLSSSGSTSGIVGSPFLLGFLFHWRQLQPAFTSLDRVLREVGI